MLSQVKIRAMRHALQLAKTRCGEGKAAIFPLVDKDGMPEIAGNIYNDLRKTWNVEMDVKQNIGKRYARMDEAGTPYCFTVDTQTLSDQTLTVRHRDTLAQERINVAEIRNFLSKKLEPRVYSKCIF